MLQSIKGNCPSSKTRRTLGAFDLTFTDRLDLHIVPAPRSPSSKLAKSKGKSPIYGKGVDGPQAQVHAAVVPAPPAPVPAVQAREDGRIWVQSWNTLGMPTFGDLRVKEMYHLLKVQESETGAVVSWDATGESDAAERIGNGLGWDDRSRRNQDARQTRRMPRSCWRRCTTGP